MATEINRDNFEVEVEQSELPIVVDIWGPQCKPCLALMPSVSDMEKEYEGRLRIGKLNATENRMLCAKLRVMGMPAFLFFKDGKEVNRIASENVTIKDIKEAADALLAS